MVIVGQALELLTGGLFKSTIHRVVTPPVDQENELRLGVYYFSRPNDTQLLEPFPFSPLLKEMGLDKPIDPEVYTATEFVNKKRNGYMKRDFDTDRPIIAGDDA